jgi:hypothetical protein
MGEITQKVAASGGLPLGEHHISTIGQSDCKQLLASDIMKHNRAKKAKAGIGREREYRGVVLVQTTWLPTLGSVQTMVQTIRFKPV